MHQRLVYIYKLNVPSFSTRYFNKIKRMSRLGRLLALSLEILVKDFIILNQVDSEKNDEKCPYVLYRSDRVKKIKILKKRQNED